MSKRTFSRRATLAAIGPVLYLGAAAARAQTPATTLTITMEWAPHGFHAPFYLAQRKGWFRDAGIDLTIRDGKGSGNTFSLVGAGQSDLGFGTLAALAIARSKGVPVKAVANILHRNTFGLILRKGRGLKEPRDLRGKEILYNTSSIEAQVLGGFLAGAGMTLNDVKILGVDATAKISSVLGGRGDAAVGPVPYYLALFAGKDEIETLLFADHGQKLVDFGIVANETVIATKRAALEAFVATTSRAYRYVLDGNVDEAVKAMADARPDARLDHQLNVNLFHTHALFIPSPASAGKPIGFLSLDDLGDTVQTLKGIRLVPADLRVEDLCAMEFSPR